MRTTEEEDTEKRVSESVRTIRFVQGEQESSFYMCVYVCMCVWTMVIRSSIFFV